MRFTRHLNRVHCSSPAVHSTYEAVAFKCGEVDSTAEQNQGSAKIFSFAKLQELPAETTLELFGRFYRDDVIKNPDGNDHGNIRSESACLKLMA